MTGRLSTEGTHCPTVNDSRLSIPPRFVQPKMVRLTEYSYVLIQTRPFPHLQLKGRLIGAMISPSTAPGTPSYPQPMGAIVQRRESPVTRRKILIRWETFSLANRVFIHRVTSELHCGHEGPAECPVELFLLGQVKLFWRIV